ncbi:MAG: hypothetical protein H0V81_06880 [Solirubrobacterales bacterium]|nr:hypothetical protein [Solirubrobacterales bacterium]
MKERAALIFPYALAIALPLVGLVLALTKITEERLDEAAAIALATVLGCVLYALLLL